MSKIYIADKPTLDAVKETTDKILDIVSADGVYGFIEHCGVLSPTQRIEYIGMNKDYTPLTLDADGSANYGSWGQFPTIVGNKPWMVRADGTPDYRLSETDYTKKEDEVTASDVANTSYNGGAFAWLPKIYKFEQMLGNDRHVLFSTVPREGFEAVGFIDDSNNELEGVWIPMFYGAIDSNSKMRSLSGTQPSASTITTSEKSAIDNFSTRARFFGGAIAKTITDLLLMFTKNCDLQAALGYGNMSGYNASDPHYGVKANAVVQGGQFYGNFTGTSLNKIFHSVVLGTYQQYQRDPYTLLVDGIQKVSKNYAYDLTGASYAVTGIKFDSSSSGWEYPNVFRTIPGFGSEGARPCLGTDHTGGCDGLYVNASGVRVGLRFGSCSSGRNAGLRCLFLNNAASDANWAVGASVLLLPPVGVAA